MDTPDEFRKIIKDFIGDLHTTFPDIILEAKYPDLYNLLNAVVDNSDYDDTINNLFEYCKKVYPERFFDILYQNNDIFTDQAINTCFLPDMDFKSLWCEDISASTRETIWKYLQLILFSVVKNIKSQESFGDTAKLFEAINEGEFKSKIAETIAQMEQIFNKVPASASGENDPNTDGTTKNNLPNPDDLHKHITGMMDGKLGKLAKEIAEETAEDLGLDLDCSGADISTVIKQLFKDPTKIMKLVKNVGSKLDTKIKNGDIKESELLEEASELVNKMKSLPGMDNFEKMFGKMGLPGGGKVDMNAFQQHMQQNLKNAKMKERMRGKLNENDKGTADDVRRAQEKAQSDILNYKNNKDVSEFLTSLGLNDDGKEEFVFKNGDNVERSKPKKKKKKNGGKKA